MDLKRILFTHSWHFKRFALLNEKKQRFAVHECQKRHEIKMYEVRTYRKQDK